MVKLGLFDFIVTVLPAASQVHHKVTARIDA